MKKLLIRLITGITTKVFLALYFILSLVFGLLIMAGFTTSVVVYPSIILLFIIFIFWIINKCYDFNKKHFKGLKITDKLIIAMFLLLLSINGGVVGIISISIFSCLFLYQLVTWFYKIR